MNEEDPKEYMEYFREIEDLINVAKMIEITDILSNFMFGFEIDLQQFEYPIQVASYSSSENFGNYQGDEEKILDWFKYLWKPSLHFERGICYTFDGIAITLNQTDNGIIATKAKEAMSKAMYKGALLNLKMTFDVSLNTYSQFIIE